VGGPVDPAGTPRSGVRKASRRASSVPSAGFRPLLDGRTAPEGISSLDWRRLRVLGSWPSAAGHPVRTLTRALSFDAAGVLTVGVVSPRWARELSPHLDRLRERVETLSGVRVARVVLRADPGADPRA